MWQKAVAPFVESGKLTVVGVVQEQHSERARLYAQWRQLDWPIFVDSLNLLDLKVVPVVVAIDESGVVRHTRLRPNGLAKKFVDVEYRETTVPEGYNVVTELDPQQLQDRAEKSHTSTAWRDLGDACFLAAPGGGLAHSCDPVAAYEKAVELDPKDGRAQFRLGVALRHRSESRARHAGDAQAAVERWGLALAIDPDQYIRRRRIQQYGPRLDKPYNFYFWVDEARQGIAARGETPVALSVEPFGSELAPPVERGQRADDGRSEGRGTSQTKACRSDSSRLARDTQGFVSVDTMVTPARVRPGHQVRARATFRVNDRTRPYWNNEADDLTMCAAAVSGTELGEATSSWPNPEQPETREDRTLEFELSLDEGVKPGPLKISAYALYYVCENKGGKCRYLRQDFSLTVHVDRNAPTIR